MSLKRLSLVSNSCTKTERFGHSPSLIEDLGDEKFQDLNEKMIDYFGLCCVLPNFSPSPTFTPLLALQFAVTILLVGKVSALTSRKVNFFHKKYQCSEHKLEGLLPVSLTQSFLLYFVCLKRAFPTSSAND